MFESIKVVPTNLQFLKITLSINCLLKFWLERSQSSKIESNMSTDAKLILLKSTFLNEQLSIFIFLIPVLGHCLHVMVVLAKRLPVTLIPKQNRIIPMRFDVVNHSRFHKPSLPLTLNAKRMAFKKPFSCLPPLTVIPSHCWIPTFLPMQRSVFFTIHSVHQLWTAGMLTRFLWFSWHSTTLLSYVTGTVKG